MYEFWRDEDIGAVTIVVENWFGAVERLGRAGLVFGKRSVVLQLGRNVDDGRRRHS